MIDFKWLFLCLLCCVTRLSAQQEHSGLLVQSPDGKNVKLLWTLNAIGNDVTGFDVKRKEGLQDWVKLNTEPIVPGIDMKRNFLNQGLTKGEESKIKAKLFKLLSARKLTQTDASFVHKLSADNKTLINLNKAIYADYELAVMFGFAFADHTVANKTDYKYGIFEAGTNKLLASVSWNYGEVPDLNTVSDISSRSTIGSSGVRVLWNADLKKMKAGNVSGFNVYRMGMRLNNEPIKSNSNPKDPTEFSWLDKSANSAIPIQYSISAESVFGIEGSIKSYSYFPAEHPTEYKQATLDAINSLGYYFKDGISLKWTFPGEYEKFIKGFYVEKDNMPNGYKEVSPLLPASARSFIDKTSSPISGYIRFRVTAVYNDRSEIKGAERLYNYFPVNEPPKPYNLKTHIIATGKKSIIELSWDKKLTGDSITDHYKVHVATSSTGIDDFEVFKENVVGNSVKYPVPEVVAGEYKFYVVAVKKSGVESAASDTATVQTSSIELPVPVISKTYPDTNRITIQWQYPEISDLKGFMLYMNGVAVASPKELRKTVREYVVQKVSAGTSYEFKLRALSVAGVVSEYSTPVQVVTPDPVQ